MSERDGVSPAIPDDRSKELCALRIRAFRESLGSRPGDVTSARFARFYGATSAAHWGRETPDNGSRIATDPAIDLALAYGVGLDWIFVGERRDLPEGFAERTWTIYLGLVQDAYGVELNVLENLLAGRASERAAKASDNRAAVIVPPQKRRRSKRGADEGTEPDVPAPSC